MASAPSRRGTPVRQSADLLAQLSRGHAACASLADQRNSLPSFHMRCRMPASLRATATVAFLAPIRLASRVPQALSADHFATRWRMIPPASGCVHELWSSAFPVQVSPAACLQGADRVESCRGFVPPTRAPRRREHSDQKATACSAVYGARRSAACTGNAEGPELWALPHFPCCCFGVMRRPGRERAGAGSRRDRTWIA